MLTPPDLAPEAINDLLRARYGLRAREVEFLPLGADVNATVFRVLADDGASYFLKLRRETGVPFNDLEVALPAWLKRYGGVAAAMAALVTVDGALWASGHGYTWVLFPYFAGEGIYGLTLSDAQWRAIGSAARAIHSAEPPPDLAARIPRDDYSARDRDRLRAWDARVAAETFADPIAARLAAFWLAHRDEIRLITARAEDLAATLRARAPRQVLCHGDFHGWNILRDATGDLAIVDWDAAIFSPPERDLLFAGTNITGQWDDAREVALYYEGYGVPGPDPTAEAYYRYERIIVDLAVDAGEVLGVRGSAENRARACAIFTVQFAPQQDAALARRAYERLG